MIVIDASVVHESFGNQATRAKILHFPRTIKAPEYLAQEILGLKGQIMREFGISSKKFDSRWKALLKKIVFEDAQPKYVGEAFRILNILRLDINDMDYIALYLQYKELKPLFWTYDTPFVFGAPAQKLRQEYKIFANFSV